MILRKRVSSNLIIHAPINKIPPKFVFNLLVLIQLLLLISKKKTSRRSTRNGIRVSHKTKSIKPFCWSLHFRNIVFSLFYLKRGSSSARFISINAKRLRARARANIPPTRQKDIKKHLNIFRIFVTFYGKPLEFRFFTQTLAETGYTTIIPAMHTMFNVFKSNKKKKKRKKKEKNTGRAVGGEGVR